jgi:serine/threonine protein kinase
MPEILIAGRYRLDELLGRSGMSEVWGATDIDLDRRVALKLLAPEADTARFEREARAFAALAHPNVTQLYDYGEDGGRPFMVLEYLPGGTLDDRLRSGPLSDVEAFAIAGDIAAGLAHAHSRGVVHRDLKPSNVLFDEEGRAKLADFGIARMSAGEGTLTEAGTVLGTAAYISPEQAAGEPAMPASDVYSFGVILFRMLTGRPPFEADDPFELVALHRDASRRRWLATALTRRVRSRRRPTPRLPRIRGGARGTAQRSSPRSSSPRPPRRRRGSCPRPDLRPSAAAPPVSYLQA